MGQPNFGPLNKPFCTFLSEFIIVFLLLLFFLPQNDELMFMNFKTFFFFLSREVSVSLSAKVLHYVHQLLGSCVYLLLDEEQVEYSGFTGCVLLKTE